MTSQNNLPQFTNILAEEDANFIMDTIETSKHNKDVNIEQLIPDYQNNSI